MPKFTPNAIIKDCWSSIGNITFYHRNGQCFWKRKAYHVNQRKMLLPTQEPERISECIHHISND